MRFNWNVQTLAKISPIESYWKYTPFRFSVGSSRVGSRRRRGHRISNCWSPVYRRQRYCCWSGVLCDSVTYKGAGWRGSCIDSLMQWDDHPTRRCLCHLYPSLFIYIARWYTLLNNRRRTAHAPMSPYPATVWLPIDEKRRAGATASEDIISAKWFYNLIFCISKCDCCLNYITSKVLKPFRCTRKEKTVLIFLINVSNFCQK